MEEANVPNSTAVLHIHAEGTEIVRQINPGSASTEGTTNGIHIVNVSSSVQPRFSDLHLLESGARKMYLESGVSLYKAALRGDWETAEAILSKDPNLLNLGICKGGQTVLHFAAGTKHTHFVKALVDMMSVEQLELADKKRNTAFCSAVATGAVEVAEIMLAKNSSLATIRGGGDERVTPLYLAAMFGRCEMSWCLYRRTKEILDENDLSAVFFSCIDTGIYDLALEMLKDKPSLAFARDKDNKTALHLLAVTPSAFDNQSPTGWTKLIKSCFNIGFERKSKPSKALKLVSGLWGLALMKLGEEGLIDLISQPSELLFDATKLGNFEFLAALISAYPDLLWEVDGKNRSILHNAVLYRHANIYNLIHEIGSIKDLLATYEDDENNNILHLAAMLPPPERLNIVSGPALQMQQELWWLEEVRKLQPSHAKKKNKKGQNPEELFCSQHKDLLSKGETWMKHTANSCMLVATLIATVVFAAAFTLPGGNNDNGTPNNLKSTSFLFFVLSDGLALLNSIIALIMFLSILISRYTEYDFLIRLPLKLIIGLTSLFFSMMAMMVAFSLAFVIAYDHGLKWAPLLISMLAIVPIVLFAILKFPLLLDTFSSTYCSGSVFQPRHMLN